MTSKLVPSVNDVLRSVREATRTLIAPSLSGGAERSAAATIDHLLRYAERLVEQQGQILLDEESCLKILLGSAVEWLAGRAGNEALAQAIRATLKKRADPSVYVTLAMMQDNVAVLREHVCNVLLTLQNHIETGEQTAYLLRAQLRDYIAWQLEEEGKLVEPAFLGHGPRR